jgi:hypothetical protein
VKFRLAVNVAVATVFLLACDKEKPSRPGEPPPVPKVEPKQAAKKEEPEAPKEARPSRPLNVLLLTVDALRSDMPWTTYDKPIAPHLTELAKESVVYTNHRSVSTDEQRFATWDYYARPEDNLLQARTRRATSTAGA